MRRTKEDAEKTRETLLISAVKVFNNQGFAHATLADIAKEADLTRGAIYHHFGNKDDFIDAIIQNNKDKMNQMVQKVLDSDNDVFSSIKEALNIIFQKLESDEFFRSVEELLLKMRLSGDLQEHKCELQDATGEGFNHLIEAFDEAKLNGEIANDADSQHYALCIISTFIGILTTWLIYPSAFSIKRDAPLIINRLIESLKKR